MARQPRLTVPGYPHHVIQRGNNRQPIVLDDADRLRLLALLAEHAPRCRVALHAYVLMDNHFHLLATPETQEGLSQLMQAVGRSYVRYFNNRHGRSGTLWEGRYKSTLIETDRYLLACMVYIDLNPVRAGMVAEPAQYPWSSHRHFIGQGVDKLVTPHALLWNLGNTPFAREAAYRELVLAGVSPQQQEALTHAALSGWALGSETFLNSLQEGTLRRVAPGKRGRPRLPDSSDPA
ncbi:MAG: transposase [Polaromonas sp.]|nr:transposase [Polaromonas sp.]